MTQRRWWPRWFAVLFLAGAGMASLFWVHPWNRNQSAVSTGKTIAPPPQEIQVLKLSPEARKNLSLVAKPAKLQTYWRSIQVPGVVVDRPGRSDRGVTAPAVGVVSQVYAYPGDTVRPGDRLFSLRVFSEYLQNTQSELFKATRESQLVKEQIDRVRGIVQQGALPEARLIEFENQLRRQTAAIEAYRQDLLTRGLTPEQINGVAEGKFVSNITVVAPPVLEPSPKGTAEADTYQLVDQKDDGLAYEVQELKVDLGQQVQAGQLLSYLANHHLLYIEGHAFKQEAPNLEKAAQNNWPIQVEFADDDSANWPPLEQRFHIRHLANTVDATTRTFSFFLPLTNQSRGYEKDDKTFLVWRFRPGQRVRLRIPIDEWKDVFVLPVSGVVREGPDAFVFRQNGDLFNRKAVHILHEDRLNVVIANDGNITPGIYLTQNAAASLNRVLKAQAASGVPADLHIHADGTVHGSH